MTEYYIVPHAQHAFIIEESGHGETDFSPL